MGYKPAPSRDCPNGRLYSDSVAVPNVRRNAVAATVFSIESWLLPSLAGALLLGPTCLSAQQVANVHAEPPQSAQAAKRTTPISIDGKLDEAAWQQASPITSLRQFRPVEGGDPTLKTEIRVVYDGQA